MAMTVEKTSLGDRRHLGGPALREQGHIGGRESRMRAAGGPRDTLVVGP